MSKEGIGDQDTSKDIRRIPAHLATTMTDHKINEIIDKVNRLDREFQLYKAEQENDDC